MRPLTFAGLAAVLASGCGFNFEKRSEVLDRRILAIRAEPPEIIADGSPLPQTVNVSALVVDPKGNLAPVSFEWRTCTAAVAGGAAGPATKVSGQPDPLTGRCDASDPATLVAKGEKPAGDLSTDVVAMPVPPSLGPALQIAASRGFAVSVYVDAQLQVATDDGPEPLFANKRLVVSPPLPAGRKANRNPRLAALLFDGRPWSPDEPIRLTLHGCEDDQKTTVPDPDDSTRTIRTCFHKITPAFDPGEAEHYTVQQFDGQKLDLQEHLRFDWYVDHGSFSDQQTEMPQTLDIRQRDPLTTKWNEPAATTGVVNLWVVVRDGRGGESWETRQVQLDP